MTTGAAFGWKGVIALLAIAAVASVAFASVFVIYPGSILAVPQAPPIVWAAGSNSNQSDIGGQSISVTVGVNSTQLSITVHPTYEYTYYKNVTIIKNNDATHGYYVAIRVVNPANVSSIAGASVLMNISNSTSYEIISLTSTGTYYWYYLPAGGHLNVDLQYYIPPGVKLPSEITLTIQLIYSPTNSETAIPTPIS